MLYCWIYCKPQRTRLFAQHDSSLILHLQFILEVTYWKILLEYAWHDFSVPSTTEQKRWAPSEEEKCAPWRHLRGLWCWRRFQIGTVVLFCAFEIRLLRNWVAYIFRFCPLRTEQCMVAPGMYVWSSGTDSSWRRVCWLIDQESFFTLGPSHCLNTGEVEGHAGVLSMWCCLFSFPCSVPVGWGVWTNMQFVTVCACRGLVLLK